MGIGGNGDFHCARIGADFGIYACRLELIYEIEY
jgi:hypothetical protein